MKAKKNWHQSLLSGFVTESPVLRGNEFCQRLLRGLVPETEPLGTRYAVGNSHQCPLSGFITETEPSASSEHPMIYVSARLEASYLRDHCLAERSQDMLL